MKTRLLPELRTLRVSREAPTTPCSTPTKSGHAVFDKLFEPTTYICLLRTRKNHGSSTMSAEHIAPVASIVQVPVHPQTPTLHHVPSRLLPILSRDAPSPRPTPPGNQKYPETLLAPAPTIQPLLTQTLPR